MGTNPGKIPLIKKWKCWRRFLRFLTMENQLLFDVLNLVAIFFLCEDVYHPEETIGKGCSQDYWYVLYNPFWSGVTGKRLDCFNIWCPECNWLHGRWYQKWIPTIFLFWEALNCLWSIFLAITHRKDCIDPWSILWWKIQWIWFLEALEELYDSSRIHIMQGGPWHMDAPCTKGLWTNLVGTCMLYMNDAKCINQIAKHILRSEIGKYLYVKKGSGGPPTIYLRNEVSKVSLKKWIDSWWFSSSKYLQDAI